MGKAAETSVVGRHGEENLHWSRYMCVEAGGFSPLSQRKGLTDVVKF